MSEAEKTAQLEAYVAHVEHIAEDLHREVLRQGKELERLRAQVECLNAYVRESLVKPLSEETLPPHY